MPRPMLSIVIPAFNEADRISGTLAALTAYLTGTSWSWEILVVDDGSSDDTPAIVEAASHREARIRLQREPHRGKGGAACAGLLRARGDYRFLCDADLSMPPRELPRFLPPLLTGVDVAIGSREGMGARRVGEPLLRHITGRIFNAVVRLLLIPEIRDTQCGFKMFTAPAVESVFPHATVRGWAFDIEVLHLARRLGLRIREVPIEWHYRASSHLNVMRDSWGMLREVLAIRARGGRSLTSAGRKAA